MKIDNFIITGFYTEKTPYKEVMEEFLIPSIKKFHLKSYIEALPNKGSWLLNVAQKPQSILRCMIENPSSDIVSLDADAQIMEYPSLFANIPEEYDIACHILDWNTWYLNKSDVKELLSGTLFIRNNQKMKEVVSEWGLKATKSCEWEQKVLAEVIKERQDVKVYELPLSYCYINSLPNGQIPNIIIENPVIVHNQVSRRLKKQIRLS